MGETDPTDRPDGLGGPLVADGSLVRTARRLLSADRCSLLEERGERLEVVDSTDERAVGATVPRWTGLLGLAYERGEATLIDDQLDRRGSAAASGTATTTAPFRSLCCVPLPDHGLLVAEATRSSAFDEEVLTSLGSSLEEGGPDRVEPTRPVEPRLDGGRPPEGGDGRRLQQIADIVSHDLVGPLQVVRGNLVLYDETGEPELLEAATRGLDRLEELLEEIVLLAETGDLVDELREVDFERLCRETWDDMETSGLTLTVSSGVELEADERALRHLLENLFDNAVTHAGPGTTVRVGPTPTGFFVEDDGPGIPADHLDRVRQRGHALVEGSSGLGLYIVDEIVSAHGWTLDVGRSADGGARFEVHVA